MSINISIANQKGGVGKTASTYCLAAAKARTGKKVLMIDLDQQCTLTDNCGMKPDDESFEGMNTCKLFEKETKPFDCCFRVSSTNFDNLFIVPSSIFLATVETKLSFNALHMNNSGIEIFKDNIEKLGQYFDYIFFDCLPSLGALLISALVVSDKVVIPVIPDRSSVIGIPQLIETIDSIKLDANKKLKIAGIIATKYRTQKAEHSKYLEDLEKYNLPILGIIPEASIVTKEFDFGRSCVDAHPTSLPAKEYIKIATKI